MHENLAQTEFSRISLTTISHIREILKTYLKTSLPGLGFRIGLVSLLFIIHFPFTAQANIKARLGFWERGVTKGECQQLRSYFHDRSQPTPIPDVAPNPRVVSWELWNLEEEQAENWAKVGNYNIWDFLWDASRGCFSQHPEHSNQFTGRPGWEPSMQHISHSWNSFCTQITSIWMSPCQNCPINGTPFAFNIVPSRLLLKCK